MTAHVPTENSGECATCFEAWPCAGFAALTADLAAAHAQRDDWQGAYHVAVEAREFLRARADAAEQVIANVRALADDLEAQAQRQSKVHNVDTAVGIRYAIDRLTETLSAAPTGDGTDG
jgi:acyl CoA:acetate/3-ketoacid CoA transferase alpha subunit